MIIGSGYTGAAIAHYMLKADPSAKVAIYEARDICSGATGRNGGHVKPLMHRSFEEHTKKYGEQAAAEIANTEWQHVHAIKKLTQENNIDCDFFLTRSCDVYEHPDDPRLLGDLRSYDLFMKSPYVDEIVKNDLQIHYGKEAKIISKVASTEIAFTYTAASCWPWKFVVGLLKICVNKGLQLHANTLVTTVTQRDDGKWVVKTADRGKTVCKKVVFATNAYTKSLLEEFSEVIIPQKKVACRIVPTEEDEIPHLTYTYGFLSSYRDGNYLINRADGSIVVGGHDYLMVDLEKKGEAAIDGHYDCVDDSTIKERIYEVFNKDFMGRFFTTWKNTPTKLSHSWSGILGYTNDYLPYVGELDCIGKTNAYICAGFHGHGMPRILFSAETLVGSLLEEKNSYEIKNTCPKIFKVTKERMEGGNQYYEEIMGYVNKMQN